MRTLLVLLTLALLAAPGRAEDDPVPPPPPVPSPEDLPEPPPPPEAPEGEPAPMPEPPTEPDDAQAGPERPPIEDAQKQPAPALAVQFDAPETVEGEAPAPQSTILAIEKVHDQPWVGDLLALRLDVTFEVEHCKAQELFVGAWFAFEKRGVLIKSLKKPFRDRSGFLKAQTDAVTIDVPHARYDASLWVPYGAFPAPSRGDRYPVEARIKLFRRTADGSEVVAEKTTTFTVHGPSAPTD